MSTYRSALPWIIALSGVAQAVLAAVPCVVVDTGQATCYDNRGEITPPEPGQPFSGQDAQHRGPQPSYTLAKDGLTVPDNTTGLTWQRCPDTDGDGALKRSDKLTRAADSGRGMNWQEALAWVQQQNAAKSLGHADWRLPNAKELQSIVDYTRCPDTTQSAAIDPLFSCTPITNEGGKADFPCYWSGTTHAGLRGGGAAMYVAFGRAAGWMSPRALAGGPPEPRSGPPGGRGPAPGGPPGPGAPGAQAGDYHLVDVHGAGAQRSDPKAGDPAEFPHGRGPQGDVIRINNFVRLVRGGAAD
jgi:hypothetical protein